MKRHYLTMYIVSLIILGAFAGSSIAQSVKGIDIGSVAAANPQIDGIGPNAEQRILKLGMRIFQDETIATSTIGSGQFIFLDQTTLTVSPGSEIVLDQYIFDASSGAGEIALTLSKGVLRFIGGRITKSGEGIVNTPHATIGIRGGIAAITVGKAGTNAVMLAGERMCVAGNAGKVGGVNPCDAPKAVIVTRAGGMVRVPAVEAQSSAPAVPDTAGTESESSSAAASEGSTAESGDPVYVGVVSPADIGLIFNATSPGGNGGTTQTIEPVIVQATASNSGFSEIGAEMPGAAQQEPVSTVGEQAPQTSQEEPIIDARSEPETTATAVPPEDIVVQVPGQDLLPLAAPIATTVFTPSIPITHAFTGGYAAGKGQSIILGGDGNPPPYVLRSPDGSGVIIGFDSASNAVVGEFGPLDSLGSSDIFDVTLNFGTGASSGVALDDNKFMAGTPAIETGLLTGQSQSISNLSGQGPDINGMQTAMDGTVSSAGLIGDRGVFPAGTDTTPQYLRWGWWSADYQFAGGDPGDFASRSEAIEGSWVSGVRSEIAALGTSGEATFDGLATAHVTEVGGSGSVSFVDGGRYLMTFDFGSRTGAASITGIAGSTFVSSVSQSAAVSGNHFGGVLIDSSSFSAVGAIDGSFFTGAGDSSAATGGAFDFTR